MLATWVKVYWIRKQTCCCIALVNGFSPWLGVWCASSYFCSAREIIQVIEYHLCQVILLSTFWVLTHLFLTKQWEWLAIIQMVMVILRNVLSLSQKQSGGCVFEALGSCLAHFSPKTFVARDTDICSCWEESGCPTALRSGCALLSVQFPALCHSQHSVGAPASLSVCPRLGDPHMLAPTTVSSFMLKWSFACLSLWLWGWDNVLAVFLLLETSLATGLTV